MLSACLARITAIKAAIARHPPKQVLDRLQQAIDRAGGDRERLERMRRRDPDGKAAEEMIGGCRVLSRPASELQLPRVGYHSRAAMIEKT